MEWVGLVLGVALALAALAAGGREATRGKSASQLGEAVAQRITCAARDLCGTNLRGSSGGADGAADSLGRAPGGGRRSSPGAPGGGHRRRSAAGGSRGERPAAPREAGPAPRSNGWRALGGAAGLAKRAWMVCLGYRRWRYEVEHPLTPQRTVPVGETLKMINECLNPWSFFFG